MPVRLEHITQPTEQDWIDLGKIHQDTQPQGLKLSAEELQQWLQQPHQWLIAGRFNDRIVGCLLAQQSEGQVTLSQAAVRTVTQRRGVMHQLLHHVVKWADEEQLSLLFTEVPAELSEPLKRRGIALIDDSYQYNSLNKS